MSEDCVTPPRHILVVDHYGDVRAVLEDLLLDLGYRVSLAADEAAMRAFLEAPDRVDLIVLDATLSEEPSVALALEAKERGIRLIMISGRPETMKRFHDRVDQLLHKPFGRAALERALQYAFSSDTVGQRDEDPD